MSKNDTSEWVSLRKAADMLGVHPATVRNWADEGKLPNRRTAGGHRRFKRDDLLYYAQSQGELQPLEVQVIIQNALGSARMQVSADNLDKVPWYAAMTDTARGVLRQQGRNVLEAIRRYLAAGAPDEQLAEAIRLGKEYAQLLSDDGLNLPQATRGFFYFSDFMINSILTWSELTQPRNSSEWANLLRQVNTFINAILLSIIEYYEED
ncbi:MAG: helix-turn-helix domain-containing protein [Anaerolineae bacterium]|nr:helix-turn-helix domain-containing protein [Anaerolineae bacterium]MDQ7036771.1 helix-turn-helix domain-containing protein [Anaerolineae bacterium]